MRCVAAYELSGRDPSGASIRTFGVLDVDPSGADHRLFPDDPQLPALRPAADSATMHERLGGLTSDVTGLREVDACQITPVRYKPGQRCVLRYDLRSGGERSALFGKLVAGGAGKLVTTLAALHDSRERAPAIPRVLRPLFYWSDLELIIQAAVSARDLTARALDPSAPAEVGWGWMRSAGSGLAALHRDVTADAPRRTLQDDVRELQDYEALFDRLAPHLTRVFDDTLTAIRQHAVATAEPTPVASHGALRTDQFLVDDGRGLVLMDLDGFCRATPARDIGNLLAYLDWRAIRRPEDAALLDGAGRAFLEGYGTIAPAPGSPWLAVFCAAPMLKIAGRRFQSLTLEEWELVPQLLDAAGAKLGS
jgi:hypothetical protein